MISDALTTHIKRSAADLEETSSSSQARKQAKIGGISEDLQDKIRKQLQSFPQTRKYQNTFKLVSEGGKPSYIVREQGGVLVLGKIEKQIGEGGYGTIHEVQFQGEDGSRNSYALKLSGDEDEAITIGDDGEPYTSLHREFDLLKKLNAQGKIVVFPRVYEGVTDKTGSKEMLVGYLTDLGEDNYTTYMNKHLDSSYQEIGLEFYDMAQALALLHKKYMHGDVYDANFLFKEGRFLLIDYGRARELATLWNRIDDDACDRYTKLPVMESDHFNSLPGKIEVDIDELVEEAEERGDNVRIDELHRERERLIRLCPEEAKAMDVYALGRVFYLRCYNEEPYTDEELEREDLSSLVLVPPDLGDRKLPFGLKELIERMLSLDPSARPSMPEVVEQLAIIFPDKWIQEIERFFAPLGKQEQVSSKIECLRQIDFFKLPPGSLNKAIRDLFLSIVFFLPKESRALLSPQLQELDYCKGAFKNAATIDQSFFKVVQGINPLQEEVEILSSSPDFMKRHLCMYFMNKNDQVQAQQVFNLISAAHIREDLQKRYGCF